MSDAKVIDPRATVIVVAVAAQLLCAVYLQVIEWVPLFPWNDLSHGNGQEVLDGAIAVLQVTIALAFWRRWRWAMTSGLAAYAGWLGLQLLSWWRPYLLGGRTVGPEWYFARTYKFLPLIDHRPTPDAAHVVLQLALILVIVTGIIAIRLRSSLTAWGPAPTRSNGGT